MKNLMTALALLTSLNCLASTVTCTIHDSLEPSKNTLIQLDPTQYQTSQTANLLISDKNFNQLAYSITVFSNSSVAIYLLENQMIRQNINVGVLGFDMGYGQQKIVAAANGNTQFEFVELAYQQNDKRKVTIVCEQDQSINLIMNEMSRDTSGTKKFMNQDGSSSSQSNQVNEN